MRVYLNTAEPKPKVTAMVTLGEGFGEFSKRTIQITYLHGAAEVPDNIGRWMIDTGRAIAHRRHIIEPEKPQLILPHRSFA